MSKIKTEFLFTIALEVEVLNLGDTPYGSRRVGRFGAGSFEGPKLRGTVLSGGACWMLLRRDDALEIEVRITLETDDKQQIYFVSADPSASRVSGVMICIPLTPPFTGG
jgi:hypothetical protein